MSGARAAAIVLVAGLIAARAADAAVLCRAPSSRLALREQCRKTERPLDPSELDLSALAGPQGAPGGVGPRGQPPLRIVDAAGTELGPIQFFGISGGTATVAITHPALLETVFFFLSRDGFVHNIGGAISSVFYTLPDCAGVPYLRGFADAVPFAQVYGDSAYYETGPAESRTVMSAEIDPGGSPCGSGTTTPRGTCCGNFTDTRTVAPAVRVGVATLGFVPPFRAVPR